MYCTCTMACKMLKLQNALFKLLIKYMQQLTWDFSNAEEIFLSLKDM